MSVNGRANDQPDDRAKDVRWQQPYVAIPTFACGCSPTAETVDLKSTQWWFKSTHPHQLRENRGGGKYVRI